MGFVLLGVFAFREIALQGVVMQLLTHGVSTGALFVMAGMLKERLHPRDINQMGGMWTAMPHMGAIGMLFVMASLGLPFLGSFIAEFLILIGTFNVSPVLTVIASAGLVLSALYSLRIMQKVFLGQLQTVTEPPADLSVREWVIMAALTAAIVFLGLYPQPVINMVKWGGYRNRKIISTKTQDQANKHQVSKSKSQIKPQYKKANSKPYDHLQFLALLPFMILAMAAVVVILLIAFKQSHTVIQVTGL